MRLQNASVSCNIMTGLHWALTFSELIKSVANNENISLGTITLSRTPTKPSATPTQPRTPPPSSTPLSSKKSQTPPKASPIPSIGSPQTPPLDKSSRSATPTSLLFL
jgi:hypothetical protein